MSQVRRQASAARVPARRDEPARRELTVLVHGIWQHGVALRLMAHYLKLRGLTVQVANYDFLRASPAENADAIAASIVARMAETGVRSVNLVGHSLGGIVVLHLLDRHPQLPVSKVVLLASPVRGSRVAEQMHANQWLKKLLGRSIEEGLLGGAPAYRGQHRLGIITGTGSFGLSAVVYPAGEDSDGVVTAREALMENADDAVSVPHGHTTMVFTRSCADYIARFIRTGAFR